MKTLIFDLQRLQGRKMRLWMFPIGRQEKPCAMTQKSFLKRSQETEPRVVGTRSYLQTNGVIAFVRRGKEEEAL